MTAKRLPRLPEMTELACHDHSEAWEGPSSTTRSMPKQLATEYNPPPFSRHLSSPGGPSSSPLGLLTPRRPSDPYSPSTPVLETPDGSIGRKKTFWRKLSTQPSASSSATPPSVPRSQVTRSPDSAPPTPTQMPEIDAISEHGSKHSASRDSPGPGGLGKKRSSGQLLAEFGRGLSRVGSVMKRTPVKAEDAPSTPQRQTPTRQGSKLGLSKQGSIRRQMQQGSWRGKRLSDGPEAVQEEEEGEREGHWQDVQREGVVVDVGDEGIGRPFNVAHDLHVSPDLDNLPLEWIAALKAQGMTEAELLTIAAARRRQASIPNKPLHVRTGSGRRTSQRRKKGGGGGGSPKTTSPVSEQQQAVPPALSSSAGQPITRVQLIDGPSTASSSTSPRVKQRLPALTHLDDHRPSMDATPLSTPKLPTPTATSLPSAAPSRGSSLHPSPTASVPPSAFAGPKREKSSKRLSEQLRGFASMNVDGVGSWADDVLGMVGESSSNPPVEREPMRIAPPSPTAFVTSAKPNNEVSSPRSTRSHRSPRTSDVIRRVPVPDLSDERRGSDLVSSRSSISHRSVPRTSASGRRPSDAASSPRSPTSRYTPHSPKLPTVKGAQAANRPLPPAFAAPSTPSLSTQPPAMSHSHSQSLSTAEDQEIRTPSTSDHDDVRTQLSATAYPAAGPRWRSTEAMGWATATPEQPGRKGSGVSIGHHELASPISISPSPKPKPSSSDPAMTPRAHHQTTSSETPHVSIPGDPLPADTETDYDLSIPSPLRPPPHPHFSLPASAASDAEDDPYDPMCIPEPGSPILRPSEMGLVVRNRYPKDGEAADSDDDQIGIVGREGLIHAGRESRKPSEGSIVMIHPYSVNPDGPGRPYSPHRRQLSGSGSMSLSDGGLASRKGSTPSYLSLKGETRSSSIGSVAAPLLPPIFGSPVDALHTKAKEAERKTPLPSDTEKFPKQANGDHLDTPDALQAEDDSLSPLPTTTASPSPHPFHTYLAHRTSARSLRSTTSPAEARTRESMADSTFSGEGESDYRDSVLGARVMSAHMEVVGQHEMGRMSVFSLGAYMGGKEGGLEDVDEVEGEGSGGAAVEPLGETVEI